MCAVLSTSHFHQLYLTLFTFIQLLLTISQNPKGQMSCFIPQKSFSSIRNMTAVNQVYNSGTISTDIVTTASHSVRNSRTFHRTRSASARTRSPHRNCRSDLACTTFTTEHLTEQGSGSQLGPGPFWVIQHLSVSAGRTYYICGSNQLTFQNIVPFIVLFCFKHRLDLSTSG